MVVWDVAPKTVGAGPPAATTTHAHPPLCPLIANCIALPQRCSPGTEYGGTDCGPSPPPARAKRTGVAAQTLPVLPSSHRPIVPSSYALSSPARTITTCLCCATLPPHRCNFPHLSYNNWSSPRPASAPTSPPVSARTRLFPTLSSCCPCCIAGHPPRLELNINHHTPDAHRHLFHAPNPPRSFAPAALLASFVWLVREACATALPSGSRIPF